MGCVRLKPSMFKPAAFKPTRFKPGSWTGEINPYGDRVLSGGSGGAYRIANDAMTRYELYVGSDASPTFTSSPDATSTTLPFTHALAQAVGSGNTVVYHLVTRKRNKYGVLSQNTYETLIELDENGDQIANPPSAPENVVGEAAATGAIALTADYFFPADGDDLADQWKIYATVGSDPDPANDAAAATVTMEYLSGKSYLDTSFGTYTTGQVVHVIVTAYRSSDGIQSTNTTATLVTADATVPAALGATEGGANAFLGERYEQGQ